MDWPTLLGLILGSNAATGIASTAITSWMARRNARDSTRSTDVSTMLDSFREASEADRALVDRERARADEERERAEEERAYRYRWERHVEAMIEGSQAGTMPPWPPRPSSQQASPSSGGA